MRHFKKTQAPESFTKWAKKNPNKSWEDFGKEASCVKDTLKDSLLKEQGYLCCYCECRVDKRDSHIEHFQETKIKIKDLITIIYIYLVQNKVRKNVVDTKKIRSLTRI